MTIVLGLVLIAATWIAAFLLAEPVGRRTDWSQASLLALLLFGCSGSLLALTIQ